MPCACNGQLTLYVPAFADDLYPISSRQKFYGNVRTNVHRITSQYADICDFGKYKDISFSNSTTM